MSEDVSKLFSFGGIAKEDVKIMVDRYYNLAVKHPEYDKNTHVKCVWFPLDQIAYIYTRLVQEKAAGFKTDGLRVYFGNYPEKDLSGTAFPNPYTNTAVFVSTFDDNGYHRDYFTDDHPLIPENRGEQCEPHCGGTEL